jgi:hypothetical protein
VDHKTDFDWRDHIATADVRRAKAVIETAKGQAEAALEQELYARLESRVAAEAAVTLPYTRRGAPARGRRTALAKYVEDRRRARDESGTDILRRLTRQALDMVLWIARTDTPVSQLTAIRSMGDGLLFWGTQEGAKGAHPDWNNARLDDLGSVLLDLCESVGLVAIRKSGSVHRVYATPDVLTRYGSLVSLCHSRLLRRYAARAEVTDELPVRKNPVGLLPSPRLLKTPAVHAIEQTRWRVNGHVVAMLSGLMADFAHTGSVTHFDRLSALGVAQQRLGETFILPLSADFRGRLYQSGGSLQYTGGSRFARALLEFAQGELLTEDGEFWLAQAVATLYGEHGTGSALAQWTRDNVDFLSDIIWSPAATKEHWLYRDGIMRKDGLRFWATVNAYLRGIGALTGKPELVHVPIAHDCVSSVLQHYACLTRDPTLAAKVGLTADRPTRDFYSAVGALVGERSGYDLSREAVKSGVMPRFYGQTVKSVADKLREHYPGLEQSEDSELARAIQAATDEVAGGPTRDMYKWLRALGDAAIPWEWESPSGFRVQMDYRKTAEHRLVLLSMRRDRKTRRRKKRVVIERIPSIEIDRPQSRLAAPANIVHALDSCVLLETARLGSALGVQAWAMAHDSFGAHPNYGHILYEAPRWAMRRLYSERDVPNEIAEQLRTQGLDVPDPPSRPAGLSSDFVFEHMTDGQLNQ